ncbi:MAG: hypothetical protein O3B73_00420 [bacterium]|jgi:hypothetical protein|nr:hypothetical protein [bacterium]
MFAKLAAVAVCTSLYALVRYAVFGGVSPIHIPVYLLNKSVSLACVFFLFFTALGHARSNPEKVSFWGTAVLHSAYLHVMLSLALMSKAYYPKFFGADKMNLTGELTLLFGVAAVYCTWFVRSRRYVFRHRQVFPLLTVFLVMGHLTAMGNAGWLTVEDWHGGLPPITLIGFVLAAISFILFFKPKRVSSQNIHR